jgi:hypothetical protein
LASLLERWAVAMSPTIASRLNPINPIASTTSIKVNPWPRSAFLEEEEIWWLMKSNFNIRRSVHHIKFSAPRAASNVTAHIHLTKSN